MLTKFQSDMLLCSSTSSYSPEDRALRATHTFINRYESLPRISEVAARVHRVTSSRVKAAVMELAMQGLILLVEDGRSLRCKITKNGYIRLAQIAKEIGSK